MKGAAAPAQSRTFLAFGDSITAGTKSDPVTLRLVPAAYAYTVLLQSRLAARYTLQTPIVWNEGVGGEFTSDGLIRLRPLLLQFRPEVLLLMEGTNDLLDRRLAAPIPRLSTSGR